MEIFIEFSRRFLIIGNWIFFGILTMALIAGSLNVNSRMFYFALGSIALAFLIHYLINFLTLKLSQKNKTK